MFTRILTIQEMLIFVLLVRKQDMHGLSSWGCLLLLLHNGVIIFVIPGLHISSSLVITKCVHTITPNYNVWQVFARPLEQVHYHMLSDMLWCLWLGGQHHVVIYASGVTCWHDAICRCTVVYSDMECSLTIFVIFKFWSQKSYHCLNSSWNLYTRKEL